MKDIYTKIVELFETNRFSVLATLISVTGSAPRRTGTKCLIMEDGSFLGTVGGGVLEARVLEAAEKVFETRSPTRRRFVLNGTDVADTDMLCGGDVEVFLEPVSPGNLNHLHIFKRAMEIQRRGGSGILATVVDHDRWQGGQVTKMFIDPHGHKIGSLMGIEEIEQAVADRMTQTLIKRQPALIRCPDHEGNKLEIFVEPLISDPILYVFGGGHLCSRIVPLAGLVGFRVVVIDDRPEFARPDNFPEASAVHRYPFEGVVEKLPMDESSYLVIVTRGHLHDKAVLAQSLRTDARYIGMIGSRRKIAVIYKKLFEEGFSRQDLDRVHAPIGMDIGAETPEEIAVSIVAELIKIRAGREDL
jgi:xanthine dehydrogenase accessory factor